LKTQLAQAQLQALRTQLQPHFFFNTMNTIAMLVRNKEDAEAIRVLAGLSDLLRHVLDDARADEVPLREELDFLQRYLAIEQIRFRDRLRTDISVDPNVLDALVPNLMLQPLVENAVRHGIARRAAAGRVCVSARRDTESLVLTVQDDGPGLPEDWSLDDAGVGLVNTRRRLAQLYGGDARLTVENAADGGVRAEVVLPYMPATMSVAEPT
jgi:two-component system LytT family sensor kinase